MQHLVDKFHETRRSHRDLHQPQPQSVTPESQRAWLGLPSMIRCDVSMASLRSLHEPAETSFIAVPPAISDDEVSEFEYCTKADVDADLPATADEKLDAEPHAGEEEKGDDGRRRRPWARRATQVGLCLFWLACAAVMAQHNSKVVHFKSLAVPANGVKDYPLQRHPTSDHISLSVRGAFLTKSLNIANHRKMLHLSLHANNSPFPLNNTSWSVVLAPQRDRDSIAPTISKRYFDLSSLQVSAADTFSIRLRSDLHTDAAFELGYDSSTPDRSRAALYAAIILISLYGAIILELVHRTFAAMVASIGGIALLAFYDDKPSLGVIMEWIEVDTMLLLVVMMVVIAVLAETGVFDWLAVLVFRVSHGRTWTLIHCLCVATMLVSAMLDNVTTVLLMAPVCIRLCEVMALNPRPVLMAVVLHANIGGAMTPVGDSLSLIIFTNPIVRRSGITFLTYTAHMSIGVLLILATTAVMLRHQYRDLQQLKLCVSLEYSQLWRQIRVWKQAAHKISPLSHNLRQVRHTLQAKVKVLTCQLHDLKRDLQRQPSQEFRYTLAELQQKYPLKNPALLVKAAACLLLIIALFFVQSLAFIQMLSLGWCALLGTILLLIIMDHADMDALLHRVDWTTLLFLGSMFVTMACLDRLGLIEWLGERTFALIGWMEAPSARLTVAILLVLWITMVCAAFVDSYVVAAMMVRVVVALEQDDHFELPLQPLVWALSFGAALGSGGALYGASANVVATCVAEQHGYRTTFVGYLRQCFPTVVVNTLVISVYLVVCHVGFGWNE